MERKRAERIEGRINKCKGNGVGVFVIHLAVNEEYREHAANPRMGAVLHYSNCVSHSVTEPVRN